MQSPRWPQPPEPKGSSPAGVAPLVVSIQRGLLPVRHCARSAEQPKAAEFANAGSRGAMGRLPRRRYASGHGNGSCADRSCHRRRPDFLLRRRDGLRGPEAGPPQNGSSGGQVLDSSGGRRAVRGQWRPGLLGCRPRMGQGAASLATGCGCTRSVARCRSKGSNRARRGPAWDSWRPISTRSLPEREWSSPMTIPSAVRPTASFPVRIEETPRMFKSGKREHE